MRLIKKAVQKKLAEVRQDFGRIGFWAFFAMVMPIIGLSAFIGLIYEISPWLAENPGLGAPAFIFVIAVLSGLAILPTNIVGMTSGWAFGFPLGLITMLLAIGGAVTINFFVSRRLAKGKFDQVISEKPKLNAIHKALTFGKSLEGFFDYCLAEAFSGNAVCRYKLSYFGIRSFDEVVCFWNFGGILAANLRNGFCGIELKPA